MQSSSSSASLDENIMNGSDVGNDVSRIRWLRMLNTPIDSIQNTISSFNNMDFGLGSGLGKISGKIDCLVEGVKKIDPRQLDPRNYPKTIMLEYIWIDADGVGRSKTKVITSSSVPKLADLPKWNFDGSSTGQATGSYSEVIICPCMMVPDPFRGRQYGEYAYLVLCDTWNPDGTPHPTNTRVNAAKIFSKGLDLEPWFGIEQEFFLSMDGVPIGFQDRKTFKYHESQKGRENIVMNEVAPVVRNDSMEDLNLTPSDAPDLHSNLVHEDRDCVGHGGKGVRGPLPQGGYYCGVGADHMTGRECVEKAFLYCLYAGIPLTGMNAEVAPSQWEFQVLGEGILAGDYLYLMRYIVNRVAETYGWNMNIHPKPVSDGDWNGSGCHTNFSTKPMREKGGYELILKAIDKLKWKHSEHMAVYGKDNNMRLTGKHETAPMDKFSFGVANRGASIRIPTDVQKNGCGYFEDRRPAANMDPYQVCSMIFQTTSLDT